MQFEDRPRVFIGTEDAGVDRLFLASNVGAPSW
jgi:hypothetical protein